MKKALLIGFGVILILIVLGVWIYLMFFGVPKQAGDIFANFNFGTTEEPTPIQLDKPLPEPDTNSVVDVEDPKALRQLTTKPVAGYIHLSSTTSSSVRYVEKGTGHIYEIDLSSGEEVRISGTTIPKTTEAIFSLDGTHVALTSTYGYERSTFVGEISTDNGGSIVGENLTPGAEDVYLDEKNTVFYNAPSATGRQLESKVMNTNNTTIIATIPFSSITVMWDADIDGTDYFYNKPDPDYEGALYRLEKNGFSSGGKGSFGLIPMVNEGYQISTYNDSGILNSELTKIGEGDITSIGTIVIPEKCAFASDNNNKLWCGSSIDTISDVEYANDWYKGVITTSDALWSVDLNTGESILISSPEFEVGREIDILNPVASQDGTALLFSNKKDSTLWLYDLTI